MSGARIQKAKIAVVGSVNMDLVMRAERLPVPGETIKAVDCYDNPGGKGANQAVAVAKLGGESRFLARVGDDGYGDTLVRTLEGYGVDVSNVLKTEDCCSGLAVITVMPSGENAITIVGGANDRLTVGDVDSVEDYLSGADAMLCQLEISVDTVIKAISLAGSKGVLTVLDPAPVPCGGFSEELFDVDIFSPNKSEAEAISGIKIACEQDVVRACEYFIEKGAKRVVMKLGGEGVFIMDADGKSSRVGAFAVESVDTTAAGDAFTAAMAVRYVETKDIVEAAKFGCAVGALTVTKSGAQQAIPCRNDVEEFMKNASMAAGRIGD